MAPTLVLGYDGSECAGAALDVGLRLAEEMGHELVIVFGYEPGGPGEEHRAHRDAVREHAERVTAEARARAERAGVAVEVELLAERPVDALLSVASRRDARAIIVGSWSESPIRGAILGSTPHKLLHLSDRPVLVVPVPGE